MIFVENKFHPNKAPQMFVGGCMVPNQRGLHTRILVLWLIFGCPKGFLLSRMLWMGTLSGTLSSLLARSCLMLVGLFAGAFCPLCKIVTPSISELTGKLAFRVAFAFFPQGWSACQHGPWTAMCSWKDEFLCSPFRGMASPSIQP